MNTYMNAVLNANAPAVDNRLSGATRYSGDPADADIFLLRFSSTAQQLDFSPVYDGTERHSAPPNNQTAVLAMPETTRHERTEKRELLAENKKFFEKMRRRISFRDPELGHGDGSGCVQRGT